MPVEGAQRPRARFRQAALVLALAGLAVSLGVTPAAADSAACTHHFSGPQICIRLEGSGGRNAVTGIWTNPPPRAAFRTVSLFRDGARVDTARATRSDRALAHTWPRWDTGTGIELCVKFRGSRRTACQTTG
ncbi:hypothetical protein [Streptomyces sp. AK02-01A]|uniref:hypothetical protein n=1 Tax=Streptomyces sp. AK02-01A TaxID=3028648 RepID=UPI0029BE99C0|nr:hypothetical protein [Streptomyces sp. AK02-01A]MDX3853867.1 hypothetical protein [Streptomyces sp. AK02-01A]